MALVTVVVKGVTPLVIMEHYVNIHWSSTFGVMTIDYSNGLVHRLDPHNGVLYAIMLAFNTHKPWGFPPMTSPMNGFMDWT